MHRAATLIAPQDRGFAASLVIALAQGASSDTIATIVAENRDLRDKNAKLLIENESQRTRIASLQEQVAPLSTLLFGVKRERLPASALQLLLDAIVLSADGATSPPTEPPAAHSQDATASPMAPDTEPAPERTDWEPGGAQAPSEVASVPPPPPSGVRKHRTPHGRRLLPEHLPIETVKLPPDEIPEGTRCIGQEVSYRLAYRKAGYIRLRVVREKFAEDNDDASTMVHIASVPDEMIPRGLPDPAMLAHAIHSKWADHIPYTRLSKMIARHGLEASVSTLSAWEKLAEPTARIVVDAAWEQAITKCQVMGIDATGVRVMDTPHDRRAHVWVLLADRAQVFFRYSALHTSDMPKSWLEGFQGFAVADASSVYDDLFRTPFGPTEAGCFAHARRKYFFAMPTDMRARPFLELADALFAIERDAARLSPQGRLAARKERSVPVIEHFARERDRLLADSTVDPRGPLSRALRYSLNHWAALTRFLSNGRIPLSNNDVEREIRHVAIGRRNWMHLGSDDAAEVACTWLSLIASARHAGLDSEQYLRDLCRVGIAPDTV
ncbi:IS66 family transposase [Pendulispora brunnea]|uniref:IS66 family transposase n=1 Tax=Pendulispora brunnea TaxID=2905690 RepID=A0ABZ2KP75_9BACT